jgi:negative regulator of sigma E activity
MVAGHRTQIVQVNALGTVSGNVRRFWIDPTNGAQLKIETYDRLGNTVSTSYYTSITYSPPLNKDAFAPPRIPATPQPLQGKQFSSIPSDQDAGFHVMQPAYVPDGYHFRSSSVFRLNNRNVVTLQYVNGLNVLSFSESPIDSKQKPTTMAHPHQGVLISMASGTRFVIIGNVADEELSKIAQSAH